MWARPPPPHGGDPASADAYPTAARRPRPQPFRRERKRGELLLVHAPISPAPPTTSWYRLTWIGHFLRTDADAMTEHTPHPRSLDLLAGKGRPRHRRQPRHRCRRLATLSPARAPRSSSPPAATDALDTLDTDIRRHRRLPRTRRTSTSRNPPASGAAVDHVDTLHDGSTAPSTTAPRSSSPARSTPRATRTSRPSSRSTSAGTGSR